MPLKSSLRWSLYDRTLALLPFLLGLLIAAAGVWVGAGAYLDELAFGDPSNAGEPASVPILVVGVVLGLLVWQIGRSAVRHHTTRRAMANQVDELVDDERIASNAASKVDDRIADVENDVQQLGRKVTRIEQQVRGDELGSDELAATRSSTGSLGSSPAATTTAAAPDSGDESTSGSDDGKAGAGDASAAPEAADESDASGGATAADASASGEAEADDAEASDARHDTAGGEAEDASTSDTGQDDGSDAASDDDGANDADADDAGESASDGGSDSSDDGFEWENDDADGEYYRNS